MYTLTFTTPSIKPNTSLFPPQPSQSSNRIPIQPHLKRRHNRRRKQPGMVDRNSLAEFALFLSLIPNLMRRPAIHPKAHRPIDRGTQDTEIFAPACEWMKLACGFLEEGRRWDGMGLRKRRRTTRQMRRSGILQGPVGPPL